MRKYRLLKCLPVSGRSPHAASVNSAESQKGRSTGRKLRARWPLRILSARRKIYGAGNGGRATRTGGGPPPDCPAAGRNASPLPLSNPGEWPPDLDFAGTQIYLGLR